MVLVKKWPFFQLFFLRNISLQNVFYDILERKNSFLGYKNKKFIKSKIWHFSKAVNPWFWSKNGHVFYDILKQRNAFLGYKKKTFITSKNWHFFEGVNPCIWFNNGNFSNFFVKQYRPGKCVLRYFRRKKRLCRL